MVTVWWTTEGVIHHSYLQPGQTMNAALYCEEIKIMNRKLRRMEPYLTKRKGPTLLHDNARPHSAEITKNLLMELGYDTIDHPPYSPDLFPTDYHLFFHLTVFLSKKKYTTSGQVKRAFGTFINSRDVSFLKTVFTNYHQNDKNV
jgi:histone-lysine N-methyltransferase SETMAR